MPYDRIPKIVATFTYTKAANPLKTKLNGAIFDAIMPYYLALRAITKFDYKIDIVEFGVNQWMYYPKVTIKTGAADGFTDAEVAQVNQAVDLARAALQNQLANEGATGVTIHYTYMVAGT